MLSSALPIPNTMTSGFKHHRITSNKVITLQISTKMTLVKLTTFCRFHSHPNFAGTHIIVSYKYELQTTVHMQL